MDKVSEFLWAMSQTSLAFAGVVSLVTVIRHPDAKPIIEDNAGFKLILEHNCALFFLSLFSLWLQFLTTKIDIWCSWSSFAFIAIVGTEFIIDHNRRKKCCPRNPRLHLVGFKLPTLFFIILLFFNVILFKCPVIYITGLAWLLIPPVIQFGILIIYSPTKPEA